MNVFEEAIDVLKSKVQLRKLFLDMHAEDLQRVINRIQSIQEEKVLIQLELEGDRHRKRDAIESIMSQMKEMGVKIEDFGAASNVSTRKHRPRQRFVFSYESQDGSLVRWEGATTGRIPNEFSSFLKLTGKNRKDCIVSEIS